MSASEDKREFTFIWQIENFSMLPHQHGESLTSPEFVVDMWEGIKWQMKLYPRGNENDVDFISCYLLPTVTEKKDFVINFSLTLESTDPDEDVKKTMVFAVQNHNQNIGWDEMCSFTAICDTKDLYLPHDVLSLRCHLSPMDSDYEKLSVKNKIERVTNILKTVDISRTSLRVQQMSFTWSIKKTSTCQERVETTFMKKNSPGLKVTLNFSELTNNISIPIEIQQTASAPVYEKQERLYVKCKITVVNVGENYQHSKESSHLFEFAPNDVWHFPMFIITSNLRRGKYLNQNDTLSLQCEFAFAYKNEVYHWDEKPFGIESTQQAETSNWCTSVRNICASGKFSDVQIKAGGEIFPAHKLVLCSRSSVFSAMFENDMKEKISGVVEIDDVDPSTLKRMLTFINFDDIKEKDLSREDVCNLYAAADKYNVVSLKDWCTKSLMLTLSVESKDFYDILALADAHQDKFLMTMACNFICCHETEIFYTPEWESLMDSNPKLSAKVMYEVFVNRKRI